jgi:hypothetical protein
MNKLLIALLFSAISIGPLSAMAAESKDDGSNLGTSESPQVQRQQSRTDKGATGVHQDGVNDDASDLGNSDSRQVRDQSKRTDKGTSERPAKNHRNKVMKNKDEKAGTTRGNPVQPTEPESAPPTTR